MIALMLAAALAAPSVTKAEIRPTFTGSGMTAAYMTLTSPKADTLISATCDCAISVEAHQTVVENGVSRMVGPAPVDLPAGVPVVFAPGGRHLMIMGLKRPIKPGSAVRITLKFKTAAPLTAVFSAKIAQPSAPMSGPMDHMDHMDHNNH
jgi:copper(I)-binding protein